MLIKGNKTLTPFGTHRNPTTAIILEPLVARAKTTSFGVQPTVIFTPTTHAVQFVMHKKKSPSPPKRVEGVRPHCTSSSDGQIGLRERTTKIYLLQMPVARRKSDNVLSYKRVKNEHFIINGKSTVRVEPVITMPSPTSRGRTVKVFEVHQILRENPSNTIARGALIALSFPNEHLGKTEYVWCKTDRLEETFVPYQVANRKANLAAITRN